MKLAILVISVVIMGLITFSGAADKNISGTWVMKSNDSSCSPVVLRIKMNEGIWEGKIDIPDQEQYDKEVHAITVKGDRVLITVLDKGSMINAILINDSTITGELLKDGRRDRVKFTKF